MATIKPTFGKDEAPALPAVAVRFAGDLGEPLIVIEATIRTPTDVVAYAQRIFAAAATACAEARLDMAGRA